MEIPVNTGDLVMTRAFVFIALMGCILIPSSVSAQVVDSTVCGVLANPQSFDGKIVRVRGTVVAGFEEFSIKGLDCKQAVNAILLSYPEGTKGKAGPVALLRVQLGKNHPARVADVRRTPVTLDKNNEFKRFDTLLSTPAKVSGMCLGCVKFTVTATLVGRMDATQNAGLVRDTGGAVTGIGGFGNLSRYRARLVLQSISDVSPQEIDYAKGRTGAPEVAAPAGGFFTPGAPTAAQVKRGAEAFGAPGEDNGVSVGFGGANEVPQDDTAKSNANSPDGLVFDVIFDGERLKGPAMQVALSHVGTHIADIRSVKPEICDLPLYGAEFRAWQTSVLSAVAARVKALVLPGGYVIYSQSWADSDVGRNANSGIAEFLSNWAGITNPP
jgi:hypothetical protein